MIRNNIYLFTAPGSFYLWLLLLLPGRYEILSGQSSKVSNQRPVVQIKVPIGETTFQPGQWVRYQISVSDAEDGKSDYLEIPGNQVFLDVFHLGSLNPETEADIRKTSLQHPALFNIKKKQCLLCHKLHGASMGPSFAEIRHRYGDSSSSVELLSRRITEGSKGIWGEAMMPAMKELTLTEARDMVSWIVSQPDAVENLLVVGVEGSFMVNPPKQRKSGNILLTASYLDNGSNGQENQSLEGFDQILIHYQE